MSYYQHWSRFWENFDNIGVPIVLKSNTSFLIGWKCSRLIYSRIFRFDQDLCSFALVLGKLFKAKLLYKIQGT